MSTEDRDAYEDWLIHPVTRAEATRLRKEEQSKLMALVSAARSSSDPGVRAMAVDYSTTKVLADYMDGKDGRRVDGEGD
jgi:hypothetical protein